MNNHYSRAADQVSDSRLSNDANNSHGDKEIETRELEATSPCQQGVNTFAVRGRVFLILAWEVKCGETR